MKGNVLNKKNGNGFDTEGLRFDKEGKARIRRERLDKTVKV